MEIHLRLGANKDGRIRGLDLYTLSNTGAYGEHGPTTVGLSGHKSIPLVSKVQNLLIADFLHYLALRHNVYLSTMSGDIKKNSMTKP